MNSISTRSLPVLMHHYISPHDNAIAVEPALFCEHCRAMQRSGWRGISLEEAEDYLLRGKNLPRKSVLITFDDGYLDNFLYGLPALEEYGHCGVVFAIADRLEAGDAIRELTPNIQERIHNPVQPDDLGQPARKDVYLNTAEARAMESTGRVRLAGHSMRHQGVFLGPEYEGFYYPAGGKQFRYPPEDEPPWGLPLFYTGPALANRAWLPSEELLYIVRDTVPQVPALAYRFFHEGGAAQLEKALSKLEKERWGRQEEPVEFLNRLRADLAMSRRSLAITLDRPAGSIISMAWPWGASCPEAMDLAKDVGFQVFFDVSPGPNLPAAPDHVHRFKVRAKPPWWLLSRLWIYSRPLAAKVYARFHG